MPNIDITQIPNPFPDKLTWVEGSLSERPIDWVEDTPPEWFKPVQLVLNDNTKTENDSEKSQEIFAWIINYQHQIYNFVDRIQNGEQVPIGGPNKVLLSAVPTVQIIKVTTKVRPYYFDLIPKYFSWFAKDIKIGSDSIEVVTRNPNGDDIIFEYVNGETGPFGLKSIDLLMDDASKYQSLDHIGCIAFKTTGNVLTLEFEDYW